MKISPYAETPFSEIFTLLLYPLAGLSAARERALRISDS
jgi:hypothetical protein